MLANKASAGSCPLARDLLIAHYRDSKPLPVSVVRHLGDCAGCKSFDEDLRVGIESDPKDLTKYPLSTC